MKNELPIMVVLGNPPYFYASYNASEHIEFIKPGQKYNLITKKGKHIKRTAGPNGVKVRYKTFIGNLLQDYYQINGEPLGEKNPKGLQDDYVKFIRFGQWRIDKTGSGILAFITNHGYIDNRTFRGMRRELMNNFSEIYLLDKGPLKIVYKIKSKIQNPTPKIFLPSKIQHPKSLVAT